jgi:alanine dehydrogenase
MNIAIPREHRPDEFRVGLTPAGVGVLVGAGHRCYIEQEAGLGAGFLDKDYQRAGGTIVYSGEEAYGRGDLVVKVGRPTSEEMGWLREGQTVFAFWHLASASPDTTRRLLERKVTAIAYELIEDRHGNLPVLVPMSQIAGRMCATVAASTLQNDRGGKGILLGGVPGVPPANVVILGAGVVGRNAARTFLGLGATVYVLGPSLPRLEQLSERYERAITMVSHDFNVARVVRFADVLIGAVLQPGERTPTVVTREMVRTMRSRAVILDVAIDQGGCIETSRPTTHSAPTFIEEGVIHYCVPNMPGALGRTATHALANATWPFVLPTVEIGTAASIERDPALARGVATHDGRAVHPALRPVRGGTP